MRFPRPAVLHGDNLTKEIAAAGFDAVKVAVYPEDNEIEVSGRTSAGNEIGAGDRPALQAIITAHTGQPTEEQQRPTKARQKIEAAIATLENADTNWATLTAAQKDAAARLVVRAVAKLGRFLLGRFDVPE